MPASRRLIAAAAAGCALVLAACGSSGPRPGAAVGSAVKYSDCMRAHGVLGFPDPSALGGFNLPSTVDPSAPQYVSAQKICAGLEPGPIPAHKVTAHQRQLAVSFSRCVRRHGLPDFPDPAVTAPPAGRARGIVRGGSLYWALPPGTSLRSPAFVSAAGACGWHMSPVANTG